MLPEFYPPVIGGLELHAQRLTHALVDRGHDVTVCTLAGAGGPGTTRDGSVDVIHIDGWRRHLGPFYEQPELAFHPTLPDPGVVRSLRARAVRRGQGDAVGPGPPGLGPALPRPGRPLPGRVQRRA